MCILNLCPAIQRNLCTNSPYQLWINIYNFMSYYNYNTWGPYIVSCRILLWVPLYCNVVDVSGKQGLGVRLKIKKIRLPLKPCFPKGYITDETD